MQDPSLMTVAQKRAAALDSVRTIHVSGGRGCLCEHADEGSELHAGKASIKLRPGQGLTQLKASIKASFGKLPKFRVRTTLFQPGQRRCCHSDCVVWRCGDNREVLPQLCGHHVV